MKTFLSVIGPLLCALTLAAAEWYVGGTLHQSTLKEWVQATPANRLATAGDFATKTNPTPKTMTELKARAVALEACISKVAEPGMKGKQMQMKTAEVAASCMVLQGYKP